MAAFYSFTPDYWQRARAARIYAAEILAALQNMPGGFAPGVDDANADHQARIGATQSALSTAELQTISRALRPECQGIKPSEQPWLAIVNLENATDMAAGWLARLIKQTGGVPNAV